MHWGVITQHLKNLKRNALQAPLFFFPRRPCSTAGRRYMKSVEGINRLQIQLDACKSNGFFFWLSPFINRKWGCKKKKRNVKVTATELWELKHLYRHVKGEFFPSQYFYKKNVLSQNNKCTVRKRDYSPC